MGGPIPDDRAINLEGKEVLDHLQPGAAAPGLGIAFGGGIDKVDLRLVHEDAANYLAVQEGIPLDGEINGFSGEEGDRDIAGRFVDSNILNGVSAPQEVNVNGPDITGVKGIAIEG